VLGKRDFFCIRASVFGEKDLKKIEEEDRVVFCVKIFHSSV